MEYVTAYCPESIGRAERFNKTILDMVRSMLKESGLNHEYWGEAPAYANFLRDIMPTSTSDGDKRSPWETRTGEKPELKSARTFWCPEIS